LGVFQIVIFIPVAMGQAPIVGFPIVEYLYYQQWSLLHCSTNAPTLLARIAYALNKTRNGIKTTI
jgi:hypothetical protein